MKEIRKETEIEAPVPDVWMVLTDFASYPEWNPFMRSIKGDLAEGAGSECRLSLVDAE